jgi:hypothetical protein
MPSRREFLRAGVAGTVLLACIRHLPGKAAAPSARPGGLDPGARAALTAIVPVMLATALPQGATQAQAVRAVVDGVDTAVAGLPPHLRSEVGQLFTLLTFAPTRALVAGVWQPWPEARAEEIAPFLQGWRTSRFALLQSGYHALHELIMASWYAQPVSWALLRYPGPPRVA